MRSWPDVHVRRQAYEPEVDSFGNRMNRQMDGGDVASGVSAGLQTATPSQATPYSVRARASAASNTNDGLSLPIRVNVDRGGFVGGADRHRPADLRASS